MNSQLNLSPIEIESLCAILSSHQVSQLSPWFGHPARNAPTHLPGAGLTTLAQKNLWDSGQRNLSLLGHKRLSPVLTPTIRLMIFESPAASIPIHEFYGNSKDFVEFHETRDGAEISPPWKEGDVTLRLRQFFGEKRSILHRYQLDLFEHEFILLVVLDRVRREGMGTNASVLHSYLHTTLQSGDLMLPILGKHTRDAGLPTGLGTLEEIDMSLQLLVQNGLLLPISDATSPGSVQPSPAVERLLGDIHTHPERYILREESVRDQFLSRELSLFLTQDAYLLGRCYHNSQFNSRVVHLEQLEPFQLAQLLHELSRPRDYIPRMHLEVNSRLMSHMRC